MKSGDPTYLGLRAIAQAIRWAVALYIYQRTGSSIAHQELTRSDHDA